MSGGPGIEEALRALSEAHGSAALASAFARLHGAVQSRRRSERRAVGALASTIAEACRLRDAMRADGATRAQLDEAMDKTVRLCWPTRGVYPYPCQACEGYGVVYHTCDGLDRPTCPKTKIHLAHEYTTPCFCAAGTRYRQPERRAEDFTQAGAVTKRQPTRWGRS